MEWNGMEWNGMEWNGMEVLLYYDEYNISYIDERLAPNLSTSGVRIRPASDRWGEYGTRIREKVWCRGCRGHLFLVEISRNVCLDSMIPRDLAVEIMVWKCCVERLQIVYRWFGTQSLKHLALRFGRWPEWNADS
jgi:hypothetical protein